MKILNEQELIRLLANPSEIDNFSDENYCANQNVILDLEVSSELNSSASNL